MEDLNSDSDTLEVIMRHGESSIFLKTGLELWSSGYGRRLMFEMLYVQIPAPYTGWTWYFFAFIFSIECMYDSYLRMLIVGTNYIFKSKMLMWDGRA